MGEGESERCRGKDGRGGRDVRDVKERKKGDDSDCIHE